MHAATTIVLLLRHNVDVANQANVQTTSHVLLLAVETAS
jgi:hypothetical protein